MQTLYDQHTRKIWCLCCGAAQDVDTRDAGAQFRDLLGFKELHRQCHLAEGLQPEGIAAG